jgi:hypothetical protein
MDYSFLWATERILELFYLPKVVSGQSVFLLQAVYYFVFCVLGLNEMRKFLPESEMLTLFCWVFIWIHPSAAGLRIEIDWAANIIEILINAPNKCSYGIALFLMIKVVNKTWKWLSIPEFICCPRQCQANMKSHWQLYIHLHIVAAQFLLKLCVVGWIQG